MNHAFSIEPFTVSDAKEVLALHEKALTDAGIFFGHGAWDSDVLHIPKVYQHTEGAFLVGKLDKKIIAMGGFIKKDKETAEIKRMRVDPDHQGHGYGTLLLNKLEELAKEKGYKKVWLTAASSYQQGQAFYKKNGYKQTGKISFEITESETNKGDTACELIFEKELV